MGFLSKLVNKVTGGWADVEMEAPKRAARGTTFDLSATVEVKGEPIEIEAIAFELQCMKEVAAYDADPFDGITPPPNQQAIHSQEVVVAEAQVLPAGSHHEFTASFELPTSEPATSETFTWMVRTVVRMSGNDPDSRWKILEVTDR